MAQKIHNSAKSRTTSLLPDHRICHTSRVNHAGKKLNLISNSASEISAAFRLFKSAVQYSKGANESCRALRQKSSAQTSEREPYSRLCTRISGFAFKKILDLVFTLLISAMLLACFVGHTSGAILSARILGDNIVVNSNMKCSFWNISGSVDETLNEGLGPGDYYCTDASNVTDLCLTHVAHVPTYVNNGSESCPFDHDLCTVDSYAESLNYSTKDMGINSPYEYLLHMTTTCSIVETHQGSLKKPATVEESLREALPHQFKACNGFLNLRETTIPINDEFYVTEQTLNLATEDYPATGIVTVTARRKWSAQSSVDNSTSAQADRWTSAIACHSTSSLCDEYSDCISLSRPLLEETFRRIQYSLMPATNQSDQRTLTESLIKVSAAVSILRGNNYQSDHNYMYPIDGTSGNIAGWPNKSSIPDHCAGVNNWGLNIVNDPIGYLVTRNFNAQKYGSPTLPSDGTIKSIDIPPSYQRMCSLPLLEVRGWRNIEAVSFIGLLVLASVIALASVQTEDKRLLVVVFGDKAWHATRWFWRKSHGIVRICYDFTISAGNSVMSGIYKVFRK